LQTTIVAYPHQAQTQSSSAVHVDCWACKHKQCEYSSTHPVHCDARLSSTCCTSRRIQSKNPDITPNNPQPTPTTTHIAAKNRIFAVFSVSEYFVSRNAVAVDFNVLIQLGARRKRQRAVSVLRKYNLSKRCNHGPVRQVA